MTDKDFNNWDFKREEHEIPFTKLHRKKMINWVLDHPVWTVPYKRNRANEGDAFKEILGDIDWLPGWGWEECSYIVPAFVNPTTRRVDDDDSLNTHFEVWIEFGPPVDVSKDGYVNEPEGGWGQYNKYHSSHDPRLDCGGDTLDEALLELALRVKHYYGDYPRESQGWVEWHKTHPEGLLRDE